MNRHARRYFDALRIEASECELELDGETSARCDCCGELTRTVWGYVHRRGAETVACYFVQWTAGASLADHPANFDFIVGPWGDGTVSADRCAVSLINFENADGPGVMVIDSRDRPVADSAVAGILTSRGDVVGTPFAPAVFALFDAVFTGDERLYSWVQTRSS